MFTDGADQGEQDQIRRALGRCGAEAVYLLALDTDGTYAQTAEFWEAPATGLAGVARLEGEAQRSQIARAGRGPSAWRPASSFPLTPVP